MAVQVPPKTLEVRHQKVPSKNMGPSPHCPLQLVQAQMWAGFCQFFFQLFGGESAVGLLDPHSGTRTHDFDEKVVLPEGASTLTLKESHAFFRISCKLGELILWQSTQYLNG